VDELTEAPETIFADLHRVADATCGASLFTVTVIDRARGLARRAYTSHPEDYPVSGTKPITANRWSETVIDAARPFVANTTAGFAEFFPDHAVINALGCAAALNIPVADAGTVVGTVNVLDVEGHFTPERVAALSELVEQRRAALVAAMARVPLEPSR
jgi:GAF domain-containing protein